MTFGFPLFRWSGIRLGVRRFLVAMGILFVALVVATACFVGYSLFVGQSLDKSSKQFVDEGVPAVISSWSRDQLVKLSSPQLIAKTTNGQVDHLFSSLQEQLGAYKSYDGSAGQSYVNYDLNNGRAEKETTAKYVARATFQNGKIQIKVTLVQQEGEWKFLGFYVENGGSR